MAQTLMSTNIALVLALAGLMSPANRGTLLTAIPLLYILLGAVAGFVAARMSKMWGNPSLGAQSYSQVKPTRCVELLSVLCSRRSCTGNVQALWFPGSILGVYLLLNILLWAREAANTIPPQTLLWLIALWLFVSLPLVFVRCCCWIQYASDCLTAAHKYDPTLHSRATLVSLDAV